MKEKELEEFIKKNPDAVVRAIIKAFNEKELLKIGNRSYMNAFKYLNYFDAKDLMFDGGDMLQPLRDPSKTFTDQVLIPPSQLVFQLGGNVYNKSGIPETAGMISGGLPDAGQVIQSALNTLPNGGKIFIKKGRYNISPQPAPSGSQVPYCGLILPSNIHLKGEGRNATILTTSPIPSTANAGYFTMLINKNVSTGDSDIIVEDIGFDLPPPVETATGMQAWDIAITFYGVHDSIIKRCWINNGSIGLLANVTYLNTANALTLGNNTRNIIEENVIQNETGSSGIIQGTKCWFIKNVILGAWDDALNIGSAGQGHRILYNILDNSAVVSGKGASSAVINLNNDTAVDPTTNGMSDILVEGNIIRNNNLGSGARTGIIFVRASRITIKNNIIENNAGIGIWSFGLNANDILIEGNIIRNNGSNTFPGIKIEVGAGYTETDIIIEKNIIYGNYDAIQLYSNGVLQNVLMKDNFTFNQVNNRSYWIAVESGKTLIAQLISNVILDSTPVVIGGYPTVKFRDNIGYVTENSGTATFSGNGTQTQFTIPHGLAGIPKVAIVTPASNDAKGDFYVTVDATNIYVNYATAPPAGTNNVVLYWYAEI